MAFETFLTVDKLKPRKGRRLTFLFSLAAHAVMVVVGVAMSFAGVDELGPKSGNLVTFWSPPVPPPPPAGKKQKNKTKPKTVTKPIPSDKPRAPAEPTKPEEKPIDDDDGDDPNGDEKGVKNSRGVGPGKEVETIPMVPPNVSKGFMVSNPQDPQHRPRLPPRVTRMGMSVSVLLRVCVDREGNVVDVKVLRGFDQEVDDSFIAAARTWRYRPFKVDGRPVPFCTPVSFTVQTTN